MEQYGKRYFEKIKRVFSPRMRAIFALLFVLFFAWVGGKFVLAEKEATVYIFPSVVSGEGWESELHTLGQDLSGEAELVDFTRENSAYVFLRASSSLEMNQKSAAPVDFAIPENETPLPSVAETESVLVSTSSREELLRVETQAETPVSPVFLPQESTDLPDATTDTSPSSLPNPFLPSTLLAPSPAIATSGPEALKSSEFPTQMLMGRIGRLFRVQSALALPVPSVVSTLWEDEVASTTSEHSLQETSESFLATTTEEESLEVVTESEDGSKEESATQVVPEVHEEVGGVSSSTSDTEKKQGDAPVTPMSDDPYTIATCAILGKPCHLLVFDGFGLGGALDLVPLSGATLELSLAGRGPLSKKESDRVLIRVYHAGRWEFLGELPVVGEFSNGKRGGYVSLPLSGITEWGDLADLKAVVEYVEEGEGGALAHEDRSVYVDGIWVNVKYSPLALPDTPSPETLALAGANIHSTLSRLDSAARKERRDTLVLPEGNSVQFIHSDSHPTAAITVKTDREVYQALGDTTTYFNVTNESDDPEVVRLQFYFPNDGGKVTRLSRFAHNVPYKVGAQKYDAIGYFCASGWVEATSTQESANFLCAPSAEIRMCDNLNEDKTNCIQQRTRVGLAEDTEYRDGWLSAPLAAGSFRDTESLFAKAIDFILGELPHDAIPGSEAPVAYVPDTILLQSGQTMYFRADIDVPLNGRGDFYIEAAAESGVYGLVRGAWDGSWNYRIPLTIATEKFATLKEAAVPVSLDLLPESFWLRVNQSGADLRFVSSDATVELPYWLASWNYEAQTGLAWVRLPKASSEQTGTTTKIYLYVGDKGAEARSDQFAPFRTETLLPRGVIVGGSQRDITLHAIAFTDDVRVKAGEHDEVMLKKGESALFTNMIPGMQVLADGPLSLFVSAPAASASVIPMGYAGMNFVLPGLGGMRDLSLSPGVGNASHALLRGAGKEEALDLIPESILGSPVFLEESLTLRGDRPFLAALSTSDSLLSTPLYPATDETLYGVAVGKSSVGFGTDGSQMSAICSSGNRKEIDGRREGMTTVLDHCISGMPEIADAVRIAGASEPLGVVSDVFGNLVGYLPKSEFASSYILPLDTRTVVVVCAPEDGAVSVGMFNPEGVLVATSTCEGRGARPGKIFFSPTQPFTLGSMIRSIGSTPVPFFAAIEGGAHVFTESAHTLMVLAGAPLLRAPAPNHPVLFFGEEEFVVPGEHRALDVDLAGKEKKHVNRFLSKEREFSVHELPGFTFQYNSQSNGFMRRVRELFDIAPFTISKVSVLQETFGEVPISYDIAYGNENEWSLSLSNGNERFRPGKYTLRVEIEEGGETYIDEYDFYWGVLAINYQQSIFIPGETAQISMGALSDSGNTICDARLKLWVKDPIGVEKEIPVDVSGRCDGNNVVDVPDYDATYVIPSDVSATGTYQVKLVRLDEADNVANQLIDSFEVRAYVPYVIERVGPTRIYPLAKYTMKIRVRANEAFEGDIIERVPGDFVFIDRGNANLEWGDPEHTFVTATWPTKLTPGQVVDFTYTFDAADRSPYVYLLGPLQMEPNEGEVFGEIREWQIASDAAGKMLIFWDQTFDPTGWTCVSCLSSDPFWERFVVGSSTYGGTGGTATHTPTALATVNVTESTGVGPNTTNNTDNAVLAHTHTMTPQLSGVSNLPAYRGLRVLRSDNAGDAINLPTGAIVAFDVASSSLPAGWYRYAPQDGKYARGGSTVGTTAGANTHTHTATGTAAAPVQTGVRSQNGVTNGATDFAHTHTLTATDTNAVSNEPPYMEVLFAQLTATATPANYTITLWDDTPPTGYANLSGDGGVLNGKFLKASSTYGTTGGTSEHQHVNISGATTSAASNLNNYTANASNAQAPAAHTHNIDITDFSLDAHLPPYIGVIFAKRLSGIVVYEQNFYRWYANGNVVTPTDPWPPGGSDLGENAAVDSGSQPIIPSNILRLRMSLNTTNATATPSTQAFKLQYVGSTDCANALNWTDVAAIGSSTAVWRGYNNTSVTDGALLPSVLLAGSNVAESYVEANNSPLNPATSTPGQNAEWDWVVQDNLGLASTNYCFRMVRSDGTPLDSYSAYPEVLTNSAPNTPTLSVPFDNEKVASTTPDFEFSATDSETNDLDFEIQISTSSVFDSLTIDSDSTVNPELFDNLTTPANKAPFTQGETIHFRSGTLLVNGTTYWWRVRAKDPNGANTWGAWSSGRSFTVDTTVTISTWHQTTSAQFQTGVFDGTNSSTSNGVMLNVGSTTGTFFGSSVAFSLATIGTVWGNFKVASTSPPGTLRVQLEYFTGSVWALIPDAALAGNSSGFATITVSLLSVDPTIYTTIRPRANFTDSTGTPTLLDWTIEWGYNVNTPTLYISFDNAKVATTTPYFEFMTTDPQSDDLVYEISWSTSSSFTASTTRNSTSGAGWQNLTTATDTSPFYSGGRIRYTIQSADQLSASSTYFWKVRARDPSGANNYSFWSQTRSITVDLSVLTGVWFQTAVDQFTTDSLTSITAVSTTSVTVATTTDEVMLAYAEGSVQTPRYRIFDGTTLGAEQSASSVGAQIAWVILKASPLLGQYILGTLGTDRDTNFQVYENGTWANMAELSTNAPSLQRRSFDVAYETLSGRAIAVACDGTPDPTYRIWDGALWAATGTINLAFTSNCEWVRLASAPNSNEIVALFRNTGSSYEAQVWNATTSTWGNSTTQGSMTDIAHEGMAVEYEASGNQAVIVTSDGSLSRFRFDTWNGAAWGGASTLTLGDDFEWGNLRRNKGNDDMVLCYVDQDTDIGVARWTGAGWVASVELETTGVTKEGRPVDCQYKTTTGVTNHIMIPYSDTVGTRFSSWNTVSYDVEQSINTIPFTFTDQLVRTSASGTMLGLFFDHTAQDYLFAALIGSSTWSSTQTVDDTASVTSSPYGEPFFMAPKNPATRGTLIGSTVDFDDGLAPAWDQIKWSVTNAGQSTFTLQVQYYDTASSSWKLIPDADIAGNSSGTSTSPINIRPLNTTTYNQIRLVGNFTCVSANCPTLNDWTVEWAQGITVSGSAKAHDLTTNVTSGTVAVAVNGALQTGKTATISAGGLWSIPNVTVFAGNVVEVWISGGASSTLGVAVAKYTGPGDFGGLSLNEHWMTIGSASTTGQTLSLTDLALYDNSISGNNDIFFDVDAGGDYNHCTPALPWCFDSGIYVLANNAFQPSTTTAKTVNMYDLRLAGSLDAGINTLKVGGSWRNLGGFVSSAGTVVFNATSSTRTIDSSGAATSTFFNVTFGEASTLATWSFTTAFVATGTVSMNYGTTSAGTQSMTLLGNLAIGASGTFLKGSATTTFSGTVAKTWTDSTAAKQDLGNILIDGTAKTLTLNSGAKATNVTIGADDTLNAGGANTMTVLGYWENNNIFTAQTGTVTFAATTTGQTINQGSSAFYNLTFSGAGGAWRWLNTNATTTNDLTIATGTVTLPGGTLSVGGSFDNSGGTFVNNFGILKMTATASGKNIRANGSSFNDLTFAGSGGGWTFLDTNATTSNTLTITAGTPIFPTGILAVGNDFDNTASFTANGGTLKMTSTAVGETIRLSGSSLANLLIGASGTFSILDTNAAATGDVTFSLGTTTLPSGTFTVGGSFVNTAVFTANGGTVTWNGSSGTKTINPGNSSFANAVINGTGSFTIAAQATTTANFTLTNANIFTLNSGLTLAVGGTFSTILGGASTTWAGATLALNSGTSYTLNTKTQGGDLYGTLRLAANTHIRAWSSSASTYVLDSTASLYSQNHAGVSGEVDIFGAYARTTGTEYWSANTDFDGTALATSSERAVAVRFDSGATATFSVGATLHIVGTSTATTTIDRILSGTYGLTVSSSTINAQYYKFRNLNATGLNLVGSTTVTSLANGDFTLDVIGGSSLSVSSTTIDTNPGLQIFAVSFSTSTGISSGYNVTETGTAISFWRFKEHYGNYDGEANDNDPGGNPGEIRWDDSNFIITVSGTVYADAGITPIGAPTCDGVTPNVRVKVDGAGSFAAACSATSSYYSVSGVTFSGDTVMTTYLDTQGGAQAAIVTRSAAGDLTGMNLYRYRVMVRHEDVTAMTIAAMNAYDGGDDPDIPFVVTMGSPNTLVVNPETEFWIWNAKTFIPGGNITLNSGGSGATYDGNFHIDNNAVFTAVGAESHSVGGRWVADTGATFTAASSTFTFTATTSGKSITAVSPVTFWRMNFTGVGGNWSINQALTVGENFTVNAGTVSGASSVTVSGTNISGSGAIAMTGGTFTVVSGGTFGSPVDWSFSNLTFGSSTTATTTKTASSTITVSGVLTVAANNVLEAGTSTTWTLTGTGVPLVFTGTFTAQNSVVRYSGTTGSTVTPTAYYQLDFGATGTNTPTYTLAAGTFTIARALNVGMGSSTIYVNITTNDPTITVSGDVNIRASSTLVASDLGTFTARRNWTNQGTTTPSGGTITFDATTTGFTITPGTSAFANVVVNNSSGGWTISGNVTTTANFTLTAANNFTMASGTTLEVGGVFTNGVGGAGTTWTGTTLYLNSGAGETINTKTSGTDQYDTLRVGVNTHVRMWNSAATTTTVSASGSLYSQNHNASSGALSVWGNYTRSSGTDYWSYATDFDGAALGGSSRQANVRFAPSAAMTLSGGGLEVLGASTASTTIDVQSAGTYALNISGGSTTMRYYSVRNTDANGLNISGTPLVNSLSDGDFELATEGGTLIKVAGASIDANPLVTFFRNRFATSSGITSGYNVTATGASASAWRFNLHYGNLGGEAKDSDPGGDPGYLIWDDSAAQLTISGNVYSDEGTTPIGGPTCDGVTQNVRLKVQGAGSYTSACNAGTGAYSISNVIFNPGDTITVYLDTNGGAKAANVAYDPATNIGNMHLYQNRVIVRHEQGSAVTNGAMGQYDFDQDTDIPFRVTGSDLNVFSNIGLIVWTGKTFAPGGNVTLDANASATMWDGTAHLYANAIWSSAGAQSHTIGGHFLAESGASISPASSVFTFIATTSGKTIAASTSLTFYDVAFNGVGGTWNISGLSTTTNNFTVATGTVTLPSGTLAVGGSFDNSGGTFAHNSGTTTFTATAAGKNIRANGSSFSNLEFRGSGGAWTFLDTHATTTGSVTITAGTANLPTGVFAVGNNFDNQSGAFSALSSSTLKMTSTSANRTLRFSGSYPGGLWISAAGTYAFFDTHATTTGNVTLSAGTTTFPYASLYIGGSFSNTAAFDAGTSTVTFFATSSGKTITPGNSSFYGLTINGAGGGFTVAANATTTNNTTLTSAGTFTQSSGTTLAVGGTFTNLLGGAATTWTGSTLALNSGTSYTVNTKTQGGDAYDSLRLAANTHIRVWGSSAATVISDAAASLYSQNNGAVSGSLYIYGNYARTSGTDYWSYATDFDGTALGGSSRQANVRFATSATSTFSNNSVLQMLGVAAASTTIDRQGGSGNYAITLDSVTWNAQYYQFRNLNSTGLNLTGTTTITSMNNGDFTLDVNGGSSITIASTTIDQNASGQIFTVRFATSSGVTSGYNVTKSGTTGSSLTFGDEYGNYASESYDSDGVDGCGSIRWTDSSCLISDQRTYRWRNDDGGEGALASEWYNQSWTKRQRVRLTTTGTSTLTNVQVKVSVPYDSDMQTDFDDLRFTDSSGTTSLASWMESYTSATATMWVKVPSLPASSFADIFVYYGNSTSTSGSVGTSTFTFFDDFEDASLSEYSGDTSLFEQSTSFNYERTRGLDASAGNESSGKTTDGIGQVSAVVGRDTTFRFFQYIDMTTGGGDEPCFIFAMQSPITLHQNYGVCLSPFGADHVVIAKNVANNGRNDGATQLSSKAVTYTTGWYEVSVDWLSFANQLNVTVYDSTGAVFATTTASDSSYTSGGVGFSYWGMHGGWDIPSARVYNSAVPTATFFTEQQDSGATWKAAENTLLANQSSGQNVRLRITVKNSGAPLSDQNFRLQIASKGASPNCESVAGGNYSDVTTTAGGCGSSAACMTTSTQLSDKASTTQLLAIPSGFNFAQGQLLEDPSNQTGNISLASSQFTEVEYNFQLTAFATQNSYCFRTTNGGTALDNYTKVPELSVLHGPSISNMSFNSNSALALTEGTTTVIMATGTVTDLNGYADLVNASSTFFRSSITNGSQCTADNNNCYQIATTSCSFSSCSGNSCTVSCSASMYYFADPTDVGSIFAADNWQAKIDVWDTSSVHDTDTASQELYTLRALTLPSSLDYGSIIVGEDTGAVDATTTVNNTGNVILNLLLSGSNMTAGASTIPVDKQKYATSTFTYAACATCNLLSTSTAAYSLGVTKPTSTSPFFKDIYWGLGVPLGTAASTHSGVNTFLAN